MGGVVFDLETQKSFEDVGGRHNLHLLRMSVGCLYDLATGEIRAFPESQVGLLIQEILAAPLVVGFNVKYFDYKVLAGYTREDFTALNTVDIFLDLQKFLGHRVSLDSVLKATFGEEHGKTGSGLDALRWFREGEMDKIIEYCKSDVLLTGQLYLFGKTHGYVRVWDRALQSSREVPVSW